KMSKSEARDLLREYQATAAALTEHDKLQMQTYLQLARGLNVLDLVGALRVAGVDERKRPRIAVAPADAQFCFFRRNYTTSRFVFSDRREQHGRDTGARQVIVP